MTIQEQNEYYERQLRSQEIPLMLLIIGAGILIYLVIKT